MNFYPNHSYLSLLLSLSMLINHWESLLCKFISKALNEPWQPTERTRPHKICEVSSTGPVGDLGQRAMEHCPALFCSCRSAGVLPRAPHSAAVASVDPESTVELLEEWGPRWAQDTSEKQVPTEQKHAFDSKHLELGLESRSRSRHSWKCYIEFVTGKSGNAMP